MHFTKPRIKKLDYPETLWVAEYKDPKGNLYKCESTISFEDCRNKWYQMYAEELGIRKIGGCG